MCFLKTRQCFCETHELVRNDGKIIMTMVKTYVSFSVMKLGARMINQHVQQSLAQAQLKLDNSVQDHLLKIKKVAEEERTMMRQEADFHEENARKRDEKESLYERRALERARADALHERNAKKREKAEARYERNERERAREEARFEKNALERARTEAE